MKTLISLFLLTSLFFCSCDTIDDKPVITDESTFYQNAGFENNENAITLIAGNELVFMRVNSFDQPNVFDEQYTEKFAFAVDQNIGNSIDISDGELQDLNFFYRKSCYCPLTVDTRIKSGTITGTKIDQMKWDLDIDLVLEIGYPYSEDQVEIDTTYSEYPYQFTGEFLLESL